MKANQKSAFIIVVSDNRECQAHHIIDEAVYVTRERALDAVKRIVSNAEQDLGATAEWPSDKDGTAVIRLDDGQRFVYALEEMEVR